MKLYEIVTIVDEPMFKGRSAIPDKVPYHVFDVRIEELKRNIEGWKQSLKRRPDDPHIQNTIANMESDLQELEEIGKIPYTFYAAKDREGAKFFSDQFEDGVIDEVKLSAKNLATVDDLDTLRDTSGKRVGLPGRRSISHLTYKEVNELKKAGFDGAKGIIDRVGGVEVVVFSPEQVVKI